MTEKPDSIALVTAEADEAQAEWEQAAEKAALGAIGTRLVLIESRLDFLFHDVAETVGLLETQLHGDQFGTREEIARYHEVDGRLYGHLWALAKLRGEEPPD